MKIAFYALRDFDELPLVEKYSKKYGIDYVWTADGPCEGNLKLAEGCDAISATPCKMSEKWLEEWRNYGVKAVYAVPSVLIIYLCRPPKN